MNILRELVAGFYMNVVFAITMAIDVHRFLKEERKKNDSLTLTLA